MHPARKKAKHSSPSTCTDEETPPLGDGVAVVTPANQARNKTSGGGSNTSNSACRRPTTFQDLNHDMLSMIYNFIYEPCLDSAYLLEEENEIHVGRLFLDLATVSKDFHQSCIHHVQRVPLVLRFEEDTMSKNSDESGNSMITARNHTNFFSSLLRWTKIMRPKVCVIELDLQCFHNSMTSMDVIRHCDLASLESFTIYSPSSKEGEQNDNSQQDWSLLQSSFADILRSMTIVPPIQKLEIKFDCGWVNVELLGTVASTVEQLTLKLNANSTRIIDYYGAILHAIDNMPRLETLQIYGSSSEALCIKSNSLKSLSAYGFSPTEKLHIDVLSCPMLNRLSFSENILDLRPSKFLRCADTLESLILHVDWREEDAHIERERINELSEAIRKLSKLRELFLVGFFAESSLQLFSESLQRLDCRGCFPSLPFSNCVCSSLKQATFYFDNSSMPRLLRRFDRADIAEIEVSGVVTIRVGDRGSNLLSVPDECRLKIHAYDGLIQPISQRSFR